MPKRIIEETFQAVKPKGRRGSPLSPGSEIGVDSANGDLAASLSAAGQQIAQLQSIYQQQATLIAANTQALLSNTASKGTSAVGAIARTAAGTFSGGLGLLSPIISGIAQLFGGSRSPVTALPIYSPPAAVSISAGLTSRSAPGFPPIGSSPDPAVVSGISRLFNEGRSTTTARLGDTSPLVASSNPGLPAGYVQEFPPTVATSSTRSYSTGAPDEKTFQQPSAPSQPSPQLHTTQITVNVSAMDSQSFMDRSSDIANAVREAMLNTHPINEVIAGL